MGKSIVKPNQLKGLERSFRVFLEGVSLRSLLNDSSRGNDGLFHFDLQFLADGSVRLQEPNRQGFYRQGKSKFLTLQWEEDTLADCIEQAQKLCPNIGKKTIQQAVRNLVTKIFDEQVVEKDLDSYTPSDKGLGSEKEAELARIVDLLDLSNLTQLLTKMVGELNNLACLRIVYIPLEGLKLAGATLLLGDVQLNPRNNEENDLDRILLDLEEKRGDVSIPFIRERLKNVQCFASVEVEGDEEYVRIHAMQSVIQMLHVLDLCLSSTIHQPNWAQLCVSNIIINQALPTEKYGIEGVGYRQFQSRGRSLDLRNNQQLLKVIGSTYTPPFSFEYGWWEDDWDDKKNKLNQSLDTLTTCFLKNDDISKRISRTVTWYSKAVNADTLDEQFVNLSIALESLLVDDEGKGQYSTTGSITQNLSERVTYLLEDSFEGRQQRIKETKSLYGLRSAIIHRGESVTKSQLMKMDKLVKEVFLAFLKYDFNSWSQFQEWVARQKF